MSKPIEPKKNDLPITPAPVERIEATESPEEINQCKEELAALTARFDNIQIILTVSIALLALFAILLRSYLFSTANPPSIAMILGVAFAVWFFAFVIVLILKNTNTGPLSKRINSHKYYEAKNKPPVNHDVVEQNYFAGLAKANLDSLKGYYKLVKEQSDKSFKNASTVGILGFLLIVAGVIIGLVKGIEDVPIAYISSAAGVITEFISAVFFIIYNRSVTQLKDYHKNLVDLQNLLLAFQVVDDITDKAEKNKLIAKIIECLVINSTARLAGEAEPAKPAGSGK